MRTGPRKRYYKRFSNPEERFWSAVDKSGGGCWPWTLGRSGPYGAFHLYGETVHAHRQACIFAHGEPPMMYEAMHSCGNKICCNPKHLKWAPHKEVIIESHRAGMTHSKLTAEDVIGIRAMLAEGIKPKAVAEKFGCTTDRVYRIRSRRVWAWL